MTAKISYPVESFTAYKARVEFAFRMSLHVACPGRVVQKPINNKCVFKTLPFSDYYSMSKDQN